MATVLLIDDMNLVRGAVKTILARAGHSVTEANGGEAGIAHLQKEQFDLVVNDMIMPGQDGGDVMTYIRDMPNRPPSWPSLAAARTCPPMRLFNWPTHRPMR